MKKKKSDYSTAKICSMFDVTKTTLFKWEKEGKLTKVKKDWRGWRVFTDKKNYSREKTAKYVGEKNAC